jgi:phosphatidate cytidylyltransferase
MFDRVAAVGARGEGSYGQNSMSESVKEHLFGWHSAFDDPFTVAVVFAVIVLAVGFGVAIPVLRRFNRVSAEAYADLFARWRSWILVSASMLLPILLGASWVILATLFLSVACYREYARATGLFREKDISLIIVLSMFALAIANLDHFERMFFSLAPLGVVAIAVITIPQDRPSGYIQRVALGIMGFLLFSYCLGYIGLISNDPRYRAILLLIFVGVELNDIFAYCVGKLLGRTKLLPQTSPKKTLAGSLGAAVLTTMLVAFLTHLIFRNTALDWWPRLLLLGFLLAFLGQMGDLVLSSIKRDLGIKDLGVVIPGHGGWLDRFDSLVLVLPAVYHFLSYHLGPLAADVPTRIFTGP